MKQIFTIMMALLIGGIAVQAQEVGYQPLVREGVVWHYLYGAFVPTYGFVWEDIKMQFKGDSVLNGIEYKKCYFYKEDEIPEGSQPLCLAREEDKKVMFCGFRYEVLDTLGTATDCLSGLPNEQNENGERIVYDFGDMTAFIEQIGSEVESISEVDVNGFPAKSYHITGDAIFDADLIEGVGVDGRDTGFLFGPLTVMTTCVCSMPFGLIMLEDLAGNVIYKGVNYKKYFADICHVKDKKSDFIQQNGHSLSVTVLADGMLSVIDMAGHVAISRVATQGTVEIPTAHLAAGVYLVQLSTATGTQTAKVVIN